MAVRVYRGLPGSGKSTRATAALDEPSKVGCSKGIFSADKRMVDEDGVYKFDPSKLPEAHGGCLRDFVEMLRNSSENSLIIIDNTNTTVAEIAPYAALALAYGHDLEIITIEADPVVCAARNIHGVGMETILRMEGAMKKQELPPWWKHTIIQIPSAPEMR